MDASFHLGGDGIYRCVGFQHFIWQAHGFGTRQAGPTASVTLRQIHSDIVLDAQGLTDREREGDGLLTNQLGLSIGVRTADCVPILLLDPVTRAVAAIHAGWRGTKSEIVRCAIHKMQTSFGSEPAHLLAAIGPSIRECCYEVGPDVASHFEAAFPEWSEKLSKPDGKRDLNLPEANVRQMRACGIPVAQIFDSCLCTACQLETFYSYRREPQDPGRLTSAIMRIS